MLEGLHTIKWDELIHAYGEASDVPQLLEQLASSDKSGREEALDQLHGNIWHQGTVYEATASAVPVLIQMLEQPGQADKDAILLLLSHLADGSSWHDAHQHVDFLKENAQTPEWKADISKELVWVQKATAAVRAGIPVYVRLLDAPEPVVREAAAYLLGVMPGEPSVAPDELSRRVATERDLRTCFSLILAASRNGLRDRPALEQAVAADPEPVMKLAYAIASVLCQPKDVSETTLAVLLQALSQPEPFQRLEGSPWLESDTIESFVSRYLQCLEQNEAVLSALLHALQSQNMIQATSIAEVLLRLVFQGPIEPSAQFQNLNDRQKRVLQTFAITEHLWGMTVNGQFAQFANSGLLMRGYGLPGSYAEMRRFVFGPNTPVPDPLKIPGTKGWRQVLRRLLGQ